MNKPLIGITLDWEEKGSFSERPYFALREHYFNAVENAGGVVVGIPTTIGKPTDYLDHLDGVVISGGCFSFPEEWYTDIDEPPPYTPSPRLEAELDIIRHALEQDMPLLGICAGMQLMAGMHGCKLTRNLHKYYGTDTDHWEGAPAEEAAHKTQVVKNTLLHKILGTNEFSSNSHHQESVIEGNSDVLMNCLAEDYVVEGIELPKYKFALGLQWHPEYLVSEADSKIFDAFISACRG